MLCLKNKTYMFTASCVTFVMIEMFVFTTIIGQLVIPNGILETSFVNDMGLFLQAFGCVGGIVFATVLTFYPEKFMLGAYIIMIGSILGMSFFVYADGNADRTLLCLASSFIGFFMLPMIFVGYELVVEQTKNDGVGETVSCGIINVASNLFSFLLALVLTPLVERETHQSNQLTFMILFINLLIGFMFLVLASISSCRDRRK